MRTPTAYRCWNWGWPVRRKDARVGRLTRPLMTIAAMSSGAIVVRGHTRDGKAGRHGDVLMYGRAASASKTRMVRPDSRASRHIGLARGQASGTGTPRTARRPGYRPHREQKRPSRSTVRDEGRRR
jgi:hypothetical protein